MGVRRLTLSPRAWSLLLVLAGAVLVSVGVGLAYLPAGVVVGGVALVAIGLFLIDVGR